MWFISISKNLVPNAIVLQLPCAPHRIYIFPLLIADSPAASGVPSEALAFLGVTFPFLTSQLAPPPALLCAVPSSLARVVLRPRLPVVVCLPMLLPLVPLVWQRKLLLQLLQ